ncbi:4'-phosphopantetheinyl transferase superfamily protein [Streptomyces bambusae]|uniref:4'-phosphopantetheinyl transferase family protein n=1 Tax=Streptomyces bambusae TaxID=1550616 RepID=UPI001CFDD933|nr:4'-phosphopantetheinyl transferase superfamily protein [Streptomyces bambusae]MCB5165676.1 4'-phosphopantetheinyl transferase superfamily protein [Streptomyces bambusae]
MPGTDLVLSRPPGPAVPYPLVLGGPCAVPAGTAAGRAQVWQADARQSGPGLPELAGAVLDAGELGRARALHRARDRRCYLTAHTALRVLLGARLGIAPAEVRYRRESCPCCGEPHGRPALDVPGTGVHFSLSHSGDLVLLALAATPVGVDVQLTGTASEADDVAGVLHPREEAELAACPRASRAAAFARAWVRKEAYLKGLGTGLARSPSLDYVGTTPTPPPGPPGWHLTDLTVPPAYTAAVAVRRPAA